MYKKKKIILVIFARSNSTRLKNKLFKKIFDKNLLQISINNSKTMRYVDEVIIATTNKISDDKICNIAKKNKIKFQNKNKIKYVKDRPGHDKRYALNSNKIRKELNWKHKTSLSEGLNKTFKWYLNNKKFFKQISKKNINKRFGLKI